MLIDLSIKGAISDLDSLNTPNRLINIGKNHNIDNITLEVNINNINAIKLYEKYNFEKVAVRKGYYDGVDGYLMERKMM